MTTFDALTTTRRVLIGPPRPTHALDETLLPKTLALPVFSSDPISSVAYATEAALAVLVAVSFASSHLVFPISVAIAALLAIVVLSYRQGVRAYASSGGSYIFAKENLGWFAGLLAAAALLTDYVLTVAVSVAAGVFAITSAAPSLSSHQVALSLACIAVLTLVNLRGVRESGLVFAFPTYAFVVLVYAALVVGFVKGVTSGWPHAHVPHPVPGGAAKTAGLFVLLKAFASGSAALTGVESISNGVTAFKHPQARNAARTLLLMGGIAITLFLGVSYLAVKIGARPSDSASVLSQVARASFPAGSHASFLYYLAQAFTFAILVLAANTSYQGFPRLAALLARDRYMPRQFSNLGDRLVYSNGMLILAAFATLLILVFRANVNSLIHLYVIGVFTAFTLAQTGMVRHWLRVRERGWRRSAVMNATGAFATGVVAIIVIWTKFTSGAWMVMIAIPVLIVASVVVHRHYTTVERRLSAKMRAVLARPQPRNAVILYVEQLDDATREALWYARAVSAGSLHAIHVPFGGSDPGIRARFSHWAEGEPHLEVLGREAEPLDAVLDYVWRFPVGENDFVSVVIPELFRRPSLVAAVMKRTTFALKLNLLKEPGVVVTDVPRLATASDRIATPGRLACFIPMSQLNAVSARALTYARSLGITDTRALFFAYDDDEAERMRREWQRVSFEFPLEIVNAPYRDLGVPLLDVLRAATADGETIATVVMPELVVRGTDRLLHNRRALYLKRLLLFEPNVILTSVPYQLV